MEKHGTTLQYLLHVTSCNLAATKFSPNFRKKYRHWAYGRSLGRIIYRRVGWHELTVLTFISARETSTTQARGAAFGRMSQYKGIPTKVWLSQAPIQVDPHCLVLLTLVRGPRSMERIMQGWLRAFHQILIEPTARVESVMNSHSFGTSLPTTCAT